MYFVSVNIKITQLLFSFWYFYTLIKGTSLNFAPKLLTQQNMIKKSEIPHFFLQIPTKCQKSFGHFNLSMIINTLINILLLFLIKMIREPMNHRVNGNQSFTGISSIFHNFLGAQTFHSANQYWRKCKRSCFFTCFFFSLSWSDCYYEISQVWIQ